MGEDGTIENSAIFKQFLKSKYRFILKMTLFFSLAYLLLPLCIIFAPGWMNTTIFGSLTIAWFIAFLQFPLTWIAGIIYFKKAKYYDQLIRQMKRRGNLS